MVLVVRVGEVFLVYYKFNFVNCVRVFQRNLSTLQTNIFSKLKHLVKLALKNEKNISI